jgi:hypothetical protein
MEDWEVEENTNINVLEKTEDKLPTIILICKGISECVG